MSLKKLVHAVAISAIAAGSTLPLASAANAGSGHRHGGYSQKYDWGKSNRHWNGRHNGWKHGHNHRRHRGRHLALGAFATILGIAIAAEAARAHNDRYYDYDYDE